MVRGQRRLHDSAALCARVMACASSWWLHALTTLASPPNWLHALDSTLAPRPPSAASMAAVWLHREDSDTQAYLGALDSMHKIIVAAESEATLHSICAALSAAGVGHKLWVEQPESIPTCVATRPAPRRTLKPFFEGLKLLR